MKTVKMINPNITMQTFFTGERTGINYAFFPNKPTDVRLEDVEGFKRRKFIVVKKVSTKRRKKRWH